MRRHCPICDSYIAANFKILIIFFRYDLWLPFHFIFNKTQHLSAGHSKSACKPATLCRSIQDTPTHLLPNTSIHLRSSVEIDFIFLGVQPTELYHTITDRLEYDMNYTLEMNGINANDERIEGNKTMFHFTTPSCWQINRPHFHKCRM